MRLSHLRPSADHRRRSSGNLTLDSNTLYVTQEGYVGHVYNRRCSVAEPLVPLNNPIAHDITRRPSVAAASCQVKTTNRRPSLQNSVSPKTPSTFLSASVSRQDSAAGCDNDFDLPQMAKVDDNYNLNVFRIKVLSVIFVVALAASLIVLYRRAIYHTKANV
ncbi:hypothetical protein ElyMa_005239300 [Elysia marginata]|uniref:Uncharacterized protein n=1 Tax=Elysia marginata TaxID=1093978 RepID=A0AAV4JXW6_9GAST|nr:hypothetical protein ElyMa_005239300 [Elysia marginata]